MINIPAKKSFKESCSDNASTAENIPSPAIILDTLNPNAFNITNIPTTIKKYLIKLINNIRNVLNFLISILALLF